MQLSDGKYGIISNPLPSKTAAATPTSSTVLVDGSPISFDAYNIGGNNYFKLRDLPSVLSGTAKQFEVGWDASNKVINLVAGMPYTSVGRELGAGDGKSKTARLNTASIYKNGTELPLTAYNINDNNYFKLRDLGQAFDFGVEWDGATNKIIIDSTSDYTS